jgi:hypothetical protein
MYSLGVCGLFVVYGDDGGDDEFFDLLIDWRPEAFAFKLLKLGFGGNLSLRERSSPASNLLWIATATRGNLQAELGDEASVGRLFLGVRGPSEVLAFARHLRDQPRAYRQKMPRIQARSYSSA